MGERIKPLLSDVALEVDAALADGQGVLFEGAQGSLLDVDHGTYPFVTSSNPCVGGACAGSGIGSGKIDKVTGVMKAYCTRVGEGPFPTEDFGETGELLRAKGGEFGATTGRPRRCGWNDLVAADYSVKVNGIDAIALTKLDVLSGFDQIKICVAYEAAGKKYSSFPIGSSRLADAKPVYETLAGWKDDISKCASFNEIPAAARDYVNFIETCLGVPIVLIGVGPGRDETIMRGM